MDKYNNTNKDYDCFITVKRWLENLHNHKNFIDYFNYYNYKKIAIYGAGDLGRLLYDEIKDSDIEVEYFVDRNAEALSEIDGIPVIMLNEINKMEKVDILIITPVGNYEAICRDVVKMNKSIGMLSLKDAVYEI